MVDAAHEKEVRAKETIHQLKMEIANLSKLVEQGAGLSLGQESTVHELEEQRDALTLDRDQKAIEVEELTKETKFLQDKMAELDASKQKADAELKELRDAQQQRKLEMEREQRRKERHEKDLKELKRMLDEQTMELKSKQG